MNPTDLLGQQSRMFTIAVILLFASIAILGFLWPAQVKYAFLPPIPPMLYIAIHSLVYRISIFRLRRWAEGYYTEGGEAIFAGIYLLLACIATIAILLIPFFGLDRGY